MSITRSGPPTTHDSRLWRVPLSAPPSQAWQTSFQSQTDAPDVVSARRVQFEHAALTFRSEEAHVPAWIESIDRWIADANRTQAEVADGVRQQAMRAQAQTDARRQRANDSNEKFKNL